MPNSLKCRLKKLEYQGLLSEKDLSRIYTDNDVVEEFEKIKADIKEASYDRLDGFNGGQMVVDWEDIEDMFYDHISELKGELTW